MSHLQMYAPLLQMWLDNVPFVVKSHHLDHLLPLTSYSEFCDSPQNSTAIRHWGASEMAQLLLNQSLVCVVINVPLLYLCQNHVNVFSLINAPLLFCSLSAGAQNQNTPFSRHPHSNWQSKFRRGQHSHR